MGARLDITQIVNHVRRGSPPPAPPAPSVIFNGQPLQSFLRRIVPEEGNEIVGAKVGGDDHQTGSAVEFTLNWRAEYRAYALVEDDDFKKTVAGGKRMNIRGKVIIPGGS